MLSMHHVPIVHLIVGGALVSLLLFITAAMGVDYAPFSVSECSCVKGPPTLSTFPHSYQGYLFSIFLPTPPHATPTFPTN